MKFTILLSFLLCTILLSAQTFTEVSPNVFEDVARGSVAFADIDGDGDQDVLITGQEDAATYKAKLYINDGSGNFTEKLETPFKGVSDSSVAFSDIDNDGDEDLLISGSNESLSQSTLYTNDGSGNFTEVEETPFIAVFEGSVAFSDIDNDGDQDVLITGSAGFTETSRLYTNDGAGNFTEKGTLTGVATGATAFADVDGDGDQDVLTVGRRNSSDIAKLYLNDGEGNFTEKTNTPFIGVRSSALAFSDIDNDGDQDVLITGNISGFIEVTALYTNDGEGNFSEVNNTPFRDVGDGSVAFSDVDKDGDQDVLITGTPGGSFLSILYTNDGEGNFSEVENTPFEGVIFSSIAFSDINNDGYPDLLITGFVRDSSFDSFPSSMLYKNNGLPSSIENPFAKPNFHFDVYPNPTQAQQINIRTPSQQYGLLKLSVTDLSGQPLIQQEKRLDAATQVFSLDLSSLSKGMYLLHVEDSERKGIQKILIQ